MRETTTGVHPKRKHGRTSERRGRGAFSVVRKVTRSITLNPGSRRWRHLEWALVYTEGRDLPLQGLAGHSELCGRTTRARNLTVTLCQSGLDCSSFAVSKLLLVVGEDT